MARIRPVLVLLVATGCASAPRPVPQPERPSGRFPATPAISPTQRPSPSVQPPIRTLAHLTLGAVGDVLMHGAVKECAAAHRPAAGAPGEENQGFDWLYQPIADLLASPDITLANLETPIAPRTGQGARSYVFNAPPAAVKALANAGVDVVNLANNHLFDQGRPGFLETLERLESLGMPYLGAGRKPGEAGPKRMTVGGLNIDFLAWSQFFNQDGNDCPPAGAKTPCLRAALLDADQAVEAVRRSATTADAVVVSLHWGEEYALQPRAAEVELAHRLAEAGATVVIGHHPHVLQPIEVYTRSDGRISVIAYSLGNFVSNQSRYYLPGVTPSKVGATRDGALLRVEIARRDYGRGVIQVEIAGVSYLPLWTENDTREIDQRKNPKARPSIRVVSIDRALADVRAEMASIPSPFPGPEQRRYLKLRQLEQHYQSRREAIAAALGEDWQAEAPPVSSVATSSN